jgi:hypothetical protein
VLSRDCFYASFLDILGFCADEQPGLHTKEDTSEFGSNLDLNILIYLLNVCPLPDAGLATVRECGADGQVQ